MPVGPRPRWSRPWSTTAVPPPSAPIGSSTPPSSQRVPKWWPDDAIGFARFVVELEAALDDVFGPALVDLVGGWATVSVAGGDIRLALGPLADACCTAGRATWPVALRRELSGAAVARSAVATVAVDDLDRIQPSLRVRVVAAAGPVEGVTPPFSIRVAEGLRAVLVVDLPMVRWTVARATVDRWRVDAAALVGAVAARTVRLAWQPRPAVDPATATVLTTQSPFASALLVAPDEVVSAAATWLVAVPTCHTVVLAPAPAPGRGTSAVAQLAERVADLHARGPCSLSPRLYRWCPDGSVRQLRP